MESNCANGSEALTEPSNISTLVFMDFESTSLLEGRQKPRIVELCFIAVHRSDLQNGEALHRTLPRVLNKLTLCIDPVKPMSFAASEITGLYNDSLEHQKCLSDNTVMLINSFLEHLSKPVCLLAHNGNGFDFPLLNAELKRMKQSLSEDILCADTFEAFRSLDGLPARFNPLTNQNDCNIHLTVTPKSTQISWTRNPGVKRKGLQHENGEETETKVAKNHDDKVDGSRDADKVKKKLFADDGVSTDAAITSTDAAQGISEETQNPKSNKQEAQEHVKEHDDEFSVSLDDKDYFQALYDAEIQLAKNNSVKPDSLFKQPEENTAKDPSAVKSLNCEDITDQERPKQCAVKSSTGYFVRKNIPCDTQKSQPPSPSSSGSSSEPLPGPSSSGSAVSATNSSSATPPSNWSAVSASNISSVAPPSNRQCASLDSLASNARSEPSPGSSSNGSAASASNTSRPCVPNGPAASITNNRTPNRPSTSTALSPPSVRQSYKLEQIYLRKFGSLPAKSHRAEDDCVALLQIACHTLDLLSWVERHAVKLSSVKPAF